MEKPILIVTGTTHGIGNAVAEKALTRGAQVIGISRSPDVQIGQQEQYSHIQYDLLNTGEKDLKELADKIAQITKGERAKIIHVAGIGAIDTEDEEILRNMQILNGETPVLLTKTLEENLMAVPHGNVFVSSIVAHPNTGEIPSLKKYIKSKQLAQQGLQESFPGYFTIAYPGGYKTEMMDESIRRPGAPLEWFAAVPEDPYKKGQIADKIVDVALAKKGYPKEIAAPRLASFAMRHISAGIRRKLLPFLIRQNAPKVCALYRITPQEFNKIVQWHKERQSYGENFPYDTLTFSH